MSRTKEISRDQILAGAYAIVAEQGFHHFTARAIANYLHCSTQPIYLEFKNMAEVKDAVFEMVHEYLRTKIFTRTITGESVVDMGLSYIDFAVNEVELFNVLFLEDYGGGELMYRFSYEMFSKRARLNPAYATLTEEEMIQLHNGTWITVTGLANLSSATIIRPTQEQLVAVIRDAITINLPK